MATARTEATTARELTARTTTPSLDDAAATRVTPRCTLTQRWATRRSMIGNGRGRGRERGGAGGGGGGLRCD